MSAAVLSLAGCGKKETSAPTNALTSKTDNTSSKSSTTSIVGGTSSAASSSIVADSISSSAAESTSSVPESKPEESSVVSTPTESTPEESLPVQVDWSTVPEITEDDIEYSIQKAGQVNFDNVPKGEREKLKDGCVVIKKYNGDAEYINIPQTIAGQSNIAIVGVDWGKNAKAIKYPEGITFCVYNSGSGSASNVTSVSLPDTVEYIQNFSGLSSLAEITLPKNLKTVGKTTFFRRDKLKSVTFGDKIETINVSAFNSCKGLETVNFPSKFASGECVIGVNAFEGCTSLKSIELPEGIKFSGNGQFKNCTAFESITLPDTVTELGKDTFSGCGNIKINCKGKTYNEENVEQLYGKDLSTM